MRRITNTCEKYFDINQILNKPHHPTLNLLFEEDEILYLGQLKGEVFHKTDIIVKASKIRDFCYIEEEIFHPVAEKCLEKGLNLNAIEIDTKILKTFYSDLDFNAYSFDPIGLGLNIDGLTRINGCLYKIKKIRKTKRGKLNGLH